MKTVNTLLTLVFMAALVISMGGCKEMQQIAKPIDAGGDTTLLPPEDTRPDPPVGPPPAGMVLIPSGAFEMGSEDTDADSDEQPVHTVYVGAFYIDKYEVTVGQYKQFIRATGHRALPEWVSTYSPTDRHPVVGVSWHDAMAYAVWVGKRLPTEAEWEKAARGGLAGQKYPWGNAAPNGTQCNFADRNTDYLWSDKTADDGYQYTAPIGSYPANRYGLYDMAGNVSEWCLDAYDGNFYSASPGRNPLSDVSTIASLHLIISDFTNVKSGRVLRGGSWYGDTRFVRVANRDWRLPTLTYTRYGFRCAM